MEREEREGGVMTIEDRDYKGDVDFETVKDAAFHILWQAVNRPGMPPIPGTGVR